MKIYADGADIASIIAMDKNPQIAGFTTNPSLMRKACVSDYLAFVMDAVKSTSKPISFEVIADDFEHMKRQALTLSTFGKNTYVKIPITNTKGESSIPLIEQLNRQGVKINVTAVFTLKQAMACAFAMRSAPAIISVFAGRIADTGIDPAPLCALVKRACTMNIEVLWASTRELLNIRQAEAAQCDIITVPNDMLLKLKLTGKDLSDYSLETVKMFFDDARASGYVL